MVLETGPRMPKLCRVLLRAHGHRFGLDCEDWGYITVSPRPVTRLLSAAWQSLFCPVGSLSIAFRFSPLSNNLSSDNLLLLPSLLPPTLCPFPFQSLSQ